MPTNLESALIAQESILRANLQQSRALFDHMGNRGTSVESAVREFLSKHTARHLTIGTGEVIDSAGTRSGQVDVVIANSDQPLLSPMHEPGLYLVEGVAAAGEVKSKLTTQQLENAIAAGIKFKALQNSHNAGDMILTNPVDRQRFYECPPFFVIAMESDVAVDRLLLRLHQATLTEYRRPRDAPSGEHSHVIIPPVDGVFILGKGSATFYVDGSALQMRYVDGRQHIGWAFDHSPDMALAKFMFWLNGSMPRVLRFSPIVMNYLVATTDFSVIPDAEQGEENVSSDDESVPT